MLAGELDVERFELLVDEATESALADAERCAALARKAVELWRGEPCSGLDVPVLVDEARRLSDRRFVAIELLYEAELSCGRHAGIVSELSDLVRHHPMWERLSASNQDRLTRAGTAGPHRRVRGRRCSRRLGGPAQLPRPARTFVGRAAEFAELDEARSAAAESAQICIVSGAAGVGKTESALQWAHRVRDHYPDGQLYVDLHGYSPEQPVVPGDASEGFCAPWVRLTARSSKTSRSARHIFAAW